MSLKGTSIAIMILALTGCSQEAALDDPQGESDRVVVSASMAKMAASRVYQADGDVTEGTYYFAYPQETTLEYALGIVDFDLSVIPGIGFVLLPDEEETTYDEMTWEKVGGSVPTFYLDNVAPSEGEADTENPMTLNLEDGGRFKAAVFDDQGGSNDLLWGSLQVNRNTLKTLNFQLHHNMARLVVEITVDKTYENNEDLDLGDAIVEISSINQKPLTYDRMTGLLSLSEEPEAYTPLQLVNPSIGWASTEEIDENTMVYTTKDFVLPPQDLLTSEARPRLSIRLSNDRVFSGIVPYAMNVVDSEHTTEYPMTLSFLKEHVLTLRTIVSNQPPELVFMPVKVVEWVDKGEFFVDGHQAGIYTATEFTKLIGFYNDANSYQLKRYGNLEDGTWNFNIWSPISLDYSVISGQMVPGGSDKLPYSFSFNGYTVQVYSGTTYKTVTNSATLVNILNGSLNFEGIP